MPKGKSNDLSEYNNEYGSEPVAYNVAVLSFYLLGPLWALYFAIGTVAAFLYDAFKPANKQNAWVWGWIADGCTLLMVGLSIICISQGLQAEGEIPAQKFFRPTESNDFTDSSSTNRLWDNVCGRIVAPVTTLWIFSLSTGKGFTAMLLRTKILAETLSPYAYSCFLFHQMVTQWYFAATRNG